MRLKIGIKLLYIVCIVSSMTTFAMFLEDHPEEIHQPEIPSHIGKDIRLFLRDLVALTTEESDVSLGNVIYKHSDTAFYILNNFYNIQNILNSAQLGSYDVSQTTLKLSKYIDSFHGRVAVPGARFDRYLHKEIEDFITDLDFNTVIPTSSLLGSQEGIDISSYSPSVQIIIQDILTKYLNALPLPYKKRIVMAYLEQDPGASQGDIIVAVMVEVGPIVQKLFQLIGQNAKSAQFRTAMQRLQTNLKPVPLEVSKFMIKEALGNDFARFQTAEFKNLSAASIAQALLVTTPDGTEFVVKVRKPGVVEQVAEEYNILMSKVLTTDEGKLMTTQIYNNIKEELDFTDEAKNLLYGSQVYQYCEGYGVITTPMIPEGNFVHSDVLVMTKAAGKPLSKFVIFAEQQTKLIALYLFYFLWLREALFGSGFFHGDTHAGNIFLDIKNQQKHAFVLTPIDFGACGQLSKEQQMSIILLTIGLEFNLIDFITVGIRKLALNDYDQAMFTKHLQQFFRGQQKVIPIEVNANVMSYLNTLLAKQEQQWTAAEKRTAFFLVQYLIKIIKNVRQVESGRAKYRMFIEILDKSKIQMPEAFTLFVRGKMFLEQQIKEILENQNLDSVTFYKKLFARLQKDIVPENIILDLMNTFSKTIIINILMSTLRAKFKGEGCAIL